MAEKSEELKTREDNISQAKEYYGRGSRNYLVKDYAEAAEDFSHACELYAELYGENADELGLPHLYYAKALIALAQGGENKVLALQEGEGGGEGEGEGEDEDAAEAESEAELEIDESDDDSPNDEKPLSNDIATAESENGIPNPPESDKPTETNGSGINSNTTEPQPGTSSGQTNGATSSSATANGNDVSQLADIPEDGEDEEDATNLQYAWEALEIAVKIFERMGESGLAHLADAYFELAEISLENDHCTEAVKDYGSCNFFSPILTNFNCLTILVCARFSLKFLNSERSCEIYLKLPDDNLRVIAETKYKIGLCYYMACKFDESIAAFKDSSEYLNGVIEAEKRKDDQNEKTEATISEIAETRQEIETKIAEVQEAKEQVSWHVAPPQSRNYF